MKNDVSQVHCTFNKQIKLTNGNYNFYLLHFMSFRMLKWEEPPCEYPGRRLFHMKNYGD